MRKGNLVSTKVADRAHDYLMLAEALVRYARRRGADEAQVGIEYEEAFSVDVRIGKVENLTDAASATLSLRLLSGNKLALAGSSHLSLDALRSLVGRTLERAKLGQADRLASLPPSAAAGADGRVLDLHDARFDHLPIRIKTQWARAAEAAGRAADKRVVNSHGANFSAFRTLMVLANSHRFSGAYSKSQFSLALGLQAGSGRDKAEDYGFAQATWLDDLTRPQQIGRETARRAVQLIGARKVNTQKAAVIFDPRMTAEWLGELFEALSGTAVYRRASFLAGKLGKQIGSGGVTIIDDGLRVRGLGSRPFDDEGVPTQRTVVFARGVLRSFLCNTYAARKLKLRSTGNATDVGVGPNNFYFEAGTDEPESIIRSVKNGLYLTRTIGQGVNAVTGDYSKGAYGLWIRNGELAYPVAEITISSSLAEMLRGVERVGNNLTFYSQVGGPTIKIHEMTIAGY